MTVGDRIRNRRKQLGLTQEELAKRLGVTKSSICKAENEKEDNITTDRITKFARALDCSEAFLVGWEDNIEEDKTANFMLDILEDTQLYEYAQKLKQLSPKNRERIMDLIDILTEKENGV